MVKTRHARAAGSAASIPVIEFERSSAASLGVELVGLRDLIAREVNHDLSRPQRPTFHHLFLVTEGRGTHTVDFVRHRLSPGLVLHVAPGQVQQFGMERSLDAQLLVFEPDFVKRAPSRWPAPRTFPVTRRATIALLFEAAARELEAFDGSAGARALLSTLVETLVLAVEKSPTENDASNPRTGLLARFQAALEKSFSRTREVAAYAAVLDCSPRTLARICERASGRSAKQLIDERVVLEAKRLLAHGGASAADISAQLGFAEPTQFGKFFRRTVGVTPAKFRARFV